MEIQDCTTQELIDEIVARNECNQIGYYLEIDDCWFDDDELKEELESRGFFISESKPEPEDEVRRDFERNSTAALNVLQDLLGMQHTTTKEQVIERLKSVL